MQCRGIGPHLAARGKSHGFSRVVEGTLEYILECRRGWPFKTRVCSVTSGLLSSCEGHLGILLEAWRGNRDASRGEAGDAVSLSSCYSDIGIPINFQVESGIVSFRNIELRVSFKLSKGCEASCGDEAGN